MMMQSIYIISIPIYGIHEARKVSRGIRLAGAQRGCVRRGRVPVRPAMRVARAGPVGGRLEGVVAGK